MLLGLLVVAVAGAFAYGFTALVIQGKESSAKETPAQATTSEVADEHRPTSKAAVLVTSGAVLFVWALFESGAWMVTLYALSGLLLGGGIRLLVVRPKR